MIVTHVILITLSASVWSRYGIGQIEYRQEKFEMAAFNFKCALNVRALLSCSLNRTLPNSTPMHDACVTFPALLLSLEPCTL